MNIELDRRIYNIEDIQSVATSDENDIGKKDISLILFFIIRLSLLRKLYMEH